MGPELVWGKRGSLFRAKKLRLDLLERHHASDFIGLTS